VFLVVLIDLIGFGIVLPHLAFYASEFHASSFLIGFLYSIYSMAQLVFSPIWGSLSDRVGRRPIMILSTLGASGAYLLFAFSNSLALLFLSRLFAGIMAGNISTAQAYVADVTAPQDRAKGMGLIGAAFGIGFVIGPAIGAGLMHLSLKGQFFLENHYAVLGLFAACLSFISFLMVCFKLPESLEKGKAHDGGRVMKMSVFSPALWKYIRGGGLSSNPLFLPMLMFSVFLLAFGQSNLYGAFPLFCKTRLNLSPAEVGIQYAYMGLIAVVIQGSLIRTLVKRFSEAKLFLAGSVLFVIGLGLIPFAHSVRTLFLYLGIMSAGASLNGPTLASLISKQSDAGKYGTTLGASQGLAALGRALGPAWGGFLYGLSFRLPFIVTAVAASFAVWVGFKIQDV